MIQSQHGLDCLEPIKQGLDLERTDQEAKGSMIRTGARLLARQAVRLTSHPLLERVEQQAREVDCNWAPGGVLERRARPAGTAGISNPCMALAVMVVVVVVEEEEEKEEEEPRAGTRAIDQGQSQDQDQDQDQGGGRSNTISG